MLCVSPKKPKVKFHQLLQTTEEGKAVGLFTMLVGRGGKSELVMNVEIL